MISSEGSGMQADSIAMRKAIPAYPVTAMVDLMKTNKTARIFSVMRSRIPAGGVTSSESPFLRKAEAGQSNTLGGFGHLDLDRGSVGRRHFSRTQHSVLGKHFAIHLG